MELSIRNTLRQSVVLSAGPSHQEGGSLGGSSGRLLHWTNPTDKRYLQPLPTPDSRTKPQHCYFPLNDPGTSNFTETEEQGTNLGARWYQIISKAGGTQSMVSNFPKLLVRNVHRACLSWKDGLVRSDKSGQVKSGKVWSEASNRIWWGGWWKPQIDHGCYSFGRIALACLDLSGGVYRFACPGLKGDRCR